MPTIVNKQRLPSDELRREERGERPVARHEDLDWVRTVSAAGVVLLHTSSIYVSRYSQLTLLGVSPSLLANQITRFAVPVFFLLSGLGLGLSKRPMKLPDFWIYRLRKLAVPYVLWSLFYFLLDHHGDFLLHPQQGVLTFGALLLKGGAASHLWFLPVLLELYLLYPGLKWLMRRAPGWTLAVSFLVTLFCILALYVPLPLPRWLRPRLWRLFPPWIFYFVLGMAITEERLARIRELARKRALPLCAAAAALALIYSWDSVRCGNLESVKPQLLLYSPLCFLALLASWRICGKGAALPAFSAFASRHAMTVYFAHIFFIKLLRRWSFFNRSFLTLLLTFVLVYALSLLTAWVPELWSRYRRKKTAAV